MRSTYSGVAGSSTFTMAPYLTVCIACGILLCLVNYTIGAPSPQFREFGSDDECANSDRILELCQKCAIKSKSNIVYPMCCEAKEEAREWCEKFLTYGLHDPGYAR